MAPTRFVSVASTSSVPLTISADATHNLEASLRLVFVHGIANGPEARKLIRPKLLASLAAHGNKDLFSDVVVAEWNSSGDFVHDLIALETDPDFRIEAINAV